MIGTVLIVGAGGQLGRALVEGAPATANVMAVSHAELDVGDEAAVLTAIRALHPDVVINAAAYTKVDAAESDAATATRVNSLGARYLARACSEARARLVQVSTDYVFNGAGNTPYAIDALAQPINVYGATKLEGEVAVREELDDRGLVCRTSWLYAAAGRNFLTRMLELMAERPSLNVVVDQVGVPTTTTSLAAALWRLTVEDLHGIHHWCGSGVASWYDFAVAIGEEASRLGLLSTVPPIRPIVTAEFPTPAQRPRYSVLDKRVTENALGLEAEHWRVALRHELKLLAGSRA